MCVIEAAFMCYCKHSVLNIHTTMIFMCAAVFIIKSNSNLLYHIPLPQTAVQLRGNNWKDIFLQCEIYVKINFLITTYNFSSVSQVSEVTFMYEKIVFWCAVKHHFQYSRCVCTAVKITCVYRFLNCRSGNSIDMSKCISTCKSSTYQ